MDATKDKKHKLTLHIRKQLELTGVVSVERFDRDRFELHTDCGALSILGNNLHIRALNLEQGILIIDGYVHSFRYPERQSVHPKKSLLRRIFQ